jgi:hypothetical protein
MPLRLKFEFFAGVKFRVLSFWVKTLCSLHKSTWHHIPEAHELQFQTLVVNLRFLVSSEYWTEPHDAVSSTSASYSEYPGLTSELGDWQRWQDLRVFLQYL